MKADSVKKAVDAILGYVGYYRVMYPEELVQVEYYDERSYVQVYVGLSGVRRMGSGNVAVDRAKFNKVLNEVRRQTKGILILDMGWMKS